MRKFLSQFAHRGLLAACGGPVVLAIVYGVLGATGAVQALSPAEVCKGILSIAVMAFIAGGVTSIYTVERLPVATAALIHCGVLYLDYLLMYLFNSWIPRGGVGIFTVIFLVGYALVWLIVYLTIRRKTERMNRSLHSA